MEKPLITIDEASPEQLEALRQRLIERIADERRGYHYPVLAYRAWHWNIGASRYQDSETGRFMSRDKVRNLLDQSLSGAVNASDSLASMVADGLLSPRDWREAMRGEIKREAIRQYLMGIGGRNVMTPADWGRVGAMVREQYGYLEGFYQEVAGGNLTEIQIRARAGMYINSTKEGYETAHSTVAGQAGMEQEMWNLGLAEHCGDCVNYSSMGWQPIGTFPFPGDGSTQCLTGCKCWKSYRNPQTGATF